MYFVTPTTRQNTVGLKARINNEDRAFYTSFELLQPLLSRLSSLHESTCMWHTEKRKTKREKVGMHIIAVLVDGEKRGRVLRVLNDL